MPQPCKHRKRIVGDMEVCSKAQQDWLERGRMEVIMDGKNIKGSDKSR